MACVVTNEDMCSFWYLSVVHHRMLQTSSIALKRKAKTSKKLCIQFNIHVFKKEKLMNIPAAIFESENMTLKYLDKGLAVLNAKLLSVIISQVMASAFTIYISRLVFVWFSTQ